MVQGVPVQGQLPAVVVVSDPRSRTAAEVVVPSVMAVLAGEYIKLPYEPQCKKTGLGGFRRGLTQTGPNSHRRKLEA